MIQTGRKRLLYQRRSREIHQIFILPPSFCNVAAISWDHRVALLTGRVEGRPRGLRAVLFDFLWAAEKSAAVGGYFR